MEPTKLRLLLTEDCNRNCPSCYNKQWDLKALPKVKSFAGFKEILLTGGEPTLYPDLILTTCSQIALQNPEAKIYLYTADVSHPLLISMYLPNINGITVTIHTQKDVHNFFIFDKVLYNSEFGTKLSIRVNVFENIDFDRDCLLCNWKVKDNMKWIDNCPLPKGEVFMRL